MPVRARPGRPPIPMRRAGLPLLLMGAVAVAAMAMTAVGEPAPRSDQAKPRMPNPWSEALRGQPYGPQGARMLLNARFGTIAQAGSTSQLALAGPSLWAAQHADYGHARFDAAGTPAYGQSDKALLLTAYRGPEGIRGANVQSVNAAQANRGQPIHPLHHGFTCAGCYWEARLRFPRAKGTWAAFWLLTPDAPKARGHLEVDVIEYYGLGDPRGHHHSLHRWGPSEPGGHQGRGDYSGMDALADFGWHDYGVDLRGIARLGARPAAVITMDGREVARIAADADYFSKPFYYLLSLTISSRPEKAQLPQSVEVESVKVWR